MNRARRIWAGVAIAGAFLMVGVAPADAGKRVDWSVADGADPGVFFSKGGLKLRGSCDPALGVKLRTNVPRKSGLMVGVGSQKTVMNDEHHWVGHDFLHRGNDGLDIFSIAGLGNADSSVGQLIYASRKRVTSIDWTSEIADAIGAQCLYGGIATGGRKGTGKAMIFRGNEGGKRREIYDDPGQLRVFAKCTSDAGEPNLDVTLRAGSGTSGLYASSQSDFDANGIDEQAFVAYEDFDVNEPLALDGSGVADDHASGQIFVAASNTQFAIDWIGTSSRALGRDCAFAATAARADAGSDRRALYGSFGPEAVSPFYDHGDLQLSAGCVTNELALSAEPLVSGTSIHNANQSDADADATDSHLYSEDDGFDTGDSLSLITTGEDEDLLGQVVLASPDGTYSTVDYVADEDDLYGGADCSVGAVADTVPGP